MQAVTKHEHYFEPFSSKAIEGAIKPWHGMCVAYVRLKDWSFDNCPIAGCDERWSIPIVKC
jgi:hypothetical protein